MPDPRIPLEPEKTYHIWTHANGSDNLFLSDENYRYFLEKYIHHVYPVVETFAYCLMPNHLHLMVQVKTENILLAYLQQKKPERNLQGFENLEGFVSQQFSNCFNAYTKAYNIRHGRKGGLFIPRFKRKPIESDSYFTSLIAYIHNNPIHHGFVSDLNDWPHSSWHSYLLDKPTKLAKKEGLDWFGGKHELMKFHQQVEKKDVMLEFED